MKAWELFLPDILPFVPALPEPTIERAVRHAAQEFCEVTRAWRVTLEPFLTTGVDTTYDLELEQNSELVRIEGITKNGYFYPVWRPGFEEGAKDYGYTQDGKTITLSRLMEADASIVVDATLKPSNKAAGIEDMLYDRYERIITIGALGMLNNDPNRQGEFMAKCDQLRTRLWRGLSTARPRAQPNYF